MASTRGKHLLAVYADIPADIEADFNQWYNTQHIPERLAIAGFHELENDQVTSTDEWSKAANTEWTKKIRPHLKPLTNLAKRIF